ncbi:MAG: hypothetical protein JWM38_2457 [Sphingomonas bacterium]|nr:hypothetical protein [Sphingomonas bacterium]MDB5719030.1 hypothetical protein [Sphingomonas bacterium]
MNRYWVALAATSIVATPATAATPRDGLTSAAFSARDKAAALAMIAKADEGAKAILARAPGDREAQLVRAMSLAYRAKLQRGRSEAVEAGRLFGVLATADPRDPEAQAAVGAWHIDAVTDLGGFVAGTVLGAKKATGLAALDRAVTLGGNRAMFPALAGLLRLALDPQDAKARALAEAGAKGATPTVLDQILQRNAAAVLVPLRAGNTKLAGALAKQLLPFGRLAR